MLSLVLAVGITAGGVAPGWGCHGCYGCYGCYGCHGCHGCYGNAFSYGCCGGCVGCYGCYGCSGCYGCYGCYGSCYGCSGCYGCYGCYGSCHGCYGSCYGCCGGTAVIVVPRVIERKVIEIKEPRKKEGTQLEVAPDKGMVVVDLPKDAKLYIDGRLAPLTSTPRTFTTPELEPGRQYYYTLKMETEREGRVVAQSKRVTVEAGRVARVEFEQPTTTVRTASAESEAPAVAHVTVRLPKDAKLYVDNTLCPLTSGTRELETPKLEPGRQYYYTLRAEVVREGRTAAESKRVTVEAGKRVSVAFEDPVAVQAARR